MAVRTPAAGSLRHNFAHIFHTVPPFFSSTEWATQLAHCYTQCLELALEHCGALEHGAEATQARAMGGGAASGSTGIAEASGSAPVPSSMRGNEVTLAMPLLGAGARGAPVPEAVDVAVEAVTRGPAAARGLEHAQQQPTKGTSSPSLTVRFAVLLEEVGWELAQSMKKTVEFQEDQQCQEAP